MREVTYWRCLTRCDNEAGLFEVGHIYKEIDGSLTDDAKGARLSASMYNRSGSCFVTFKQVKNRVISIGGE